MARSILRISRGHKEVGRPGNHLGGRVGGIGWKVVSRKGIIGQLYRAQTAQVKKIKERGFDILVPDTNTSEVNASGGGDQVNRRRSND